MHVNMSHMKEVPPAETKQTKAQKPRPSYKTAGVDPKDLSRRLQAVQAEQKAYLERKRRARAEAQAKDGANGTGRHATEGKTSTTRSRNHVKNMLSIERDMAQYRHAPRVAASQFERTTDVRSQNDKMLVHKLSARAVKFNKDGPNASVEVAAIEPRTAPIEQMRAMKIARSRREEQYERNQFQHPAIPEVVDESNPKQTSLTQRHTFDTSHKPNAESDVNGPRRRKSTSHSGARGPGVGRTSVEMDQGAALARISTSDDSHRATFHKSDFRVDWTQSDEVDDRPRVGSPQMRKKESIWTLRGRLGSFSKHGREGREAMPTMGETNGEHALKSPKSGIFGRFKR